MDIPPIICALSSAKERVLEMTWKTIQGEQYPRIHTCIATSCFPGGYSISHRNSNIYSTTGHGETRYRVIEKARRAVGFAKSLGCHDIEFSSEDEGKWDLGVLNCLFEPVIDAGAATLSIVDTSGTNLPWKFGSLVERLRQDRASHSYGCAGVDCDGGVIGSTDCHNDVKCRYAEWSRAKCRACRSGRYSHGIGPEEKQQ